MHEDVFKHLDPKPEQLDKLKRIQDASKAYAEVLEKEVEDGPDRTYLMRNVRQVDMWAHEAVTRRSDGTPR